MVVAIKVMAEVEIEKGDVAKVKALISPYKVCLMSMLVHRSIAMIQKNVL